MIPNEFQKEVGRARKSLIFHKVVDVILRIVTLGLCNRRTRVQECQEDYGRAESKCEKYASLVAELQTLDRDGDTIQIEGVRVSKHTFSDLPVVGGQDYGIHWETLRHTILSRDNYECGESGGRCDGALQIHHIVPLSRGGSNDPSNLVTLCLYHHSLKHEHMRREQHGYIRS